MTAPANELQTAIYSALMADVDIQALVGGRVYDRAPQDDPSPSITLGPSDEVPTDSACVRAEQHTIQIDVWSEKQGGFKECKDIVSLIKRAVHEVPLVLATHAPLDARVTLTRTMRENDGLTSHGVVQVTVEIEER